MLIGANRRLYLTRRPLAHAISTQSLCTEKPPARPADQSIPQRPLISTLFMPNQPTSARLECNSPAPYHFYQEKCVAIRNRQPAQSPWEERPRGSAPRQNRVNLSGPATITTLQNTKGFGLTMPRGRPPERVPREPHRIPTVSTPYPHRNSTFESFGVTCCPNETYRRSTSHHHPGRNHWASERVTG